MAEPERKKKRQSTDFGRCVICQQSSAETVQKLTEKGFQSFLYAVTHRLDDTALRLQDEITAGEEDFLSNGPLCHAKCRNAYTNKKTVAQKMKSHVSNTSEETATTDVGSCSVRPRRGSSATGYIDHKTQCFICRRERTSKGDHKLLLVSMADRQNSIWKKAKDLQDENMLYHIHGFGDNCSDMVANDFKYHKSCLDSYLTKSQTTSTSGQHDEGVHWLTSYIDGALSHDPNDIIFLSSLRDKYRAWLSDSGASLSSSRSSSIKKKIEHYYRQHGSPIMIVPQRGQSSIICSSDMSIGYLLAKVASMKDEISAEEIQISRRQLRS